MWMSLKDVPTIPIKMYPTGRDKDPNLKRHSGRVSGAR